MKHHHLPVIALALAACTGSVSDPGGGADAAPSPGGDAAPNPGDADAAPSPEDWLDLRATPLATEPPALTAVTHALTPSPLWGDLGGPYPTNVWWLNLALGAGENPVNVLPYLVRTYGDRLGVCLPGRVVTATFIASTYLDNLTLGAAETATDRRLIAYDDLSATVQWRAAGGASMTAPLVRGMAYATMRYRGMTPRIGSQHAIVAVNGAAPAPASGTRFALELNNGQTWIVYADADVTLTPDGGGLVASAPADVTLRAALLSEPAAAAILDEHAAAIPVGGAVTAESREDTGRLRFQWRVEGIGAPLMMSLPHHREVLQSPELAALEYRTIKGKMVGVVGATWTMLEPLPTIEWSAARPVAPERTAAVEAALEADQTMTPVAGDPYFFGKQVAAMGRLALIADELGRADVAAAVRANMKTALAPWLDADNAKLVYDGTWGGIVAAGAQADPGAAFGQGYYNDHHFHYGYFLYAAAAIARADDGWATASRDAVLALARDIANPNAADGYFTTFRNKDWFTGHSWAAGLFEFADSRNQESTSEAVNAWHGLALYGLASGDARLRDLGRLLLATELRSTHAYWQISAGEEIYEAPFADNKVVGVLWSTKVDYATFFGGQVEFIHGIQMLPFTPISEALLPASWIAEEYPVLATALTRPSPPIAEGWRGFVVMAHAIIDRDAAWAEAQALTGYDDGNSRTNTLYWIATRP